MIQEELACELRRLVREAAQPVAAGESIKGQIRRAWIALGRPDFWRVRAAWHGEAGKWTASAVEDFRARAERRQVRAPAKQTERHDMSGGRQFTQITEALGLIERGDFAMEVSSDMQKLLQDMGAICGEKGKAKGEIVLKLRFDVEGRHVAITGEHVVKAPKVPRAKRFFFMTAQGGLSQEPQNDDLFAGPRPVGDRDAG
jgi:hypothetical protein